ncbi:MAG: RnfABCDGE type electron transport complex subunit D [Epsilonproteobacteria bacterium]|nr:RnfABCDGE type electron transport complex subunit D [Campylobacterota bacterium]
MHLQLHQNINLFLLLILGSYVANISLGWVEIVAILAFTVVVEHILLYFNPKREFYFSYSALSTAIGVIVLMYSSHLWIYFVVISLGLLQKHYLTLDGKQFFNPSNFAIIMALLFFYEDAHVVTGQFGDEFWLAIIVFVLAAIILIRVNRWAISIAFIVSYFLLQYMLVVSYDPVMIFEDIYHRFYSVTFTLFIYFMLTDPPVTPSKWKLQILFAFFVSLMAVLLDRFYGFRVQHLFMSVFFFSMFVTLLSAKRDTKTLKTAGVILFFVILIITFIEMQPPYYFEMDG